MITDHIYETDYAGLNPAMARCTFKNDHVRCGYPKDQHARTTSVRDDPVDMVNHPPHYTSHPSGIECIDIARYLSGDWFNAFKYVFRSDHKNGRQDVEKAEFYVKDSIKHGMPIYGHGWGIKQASQLDEVIAAETGWRKMFFLCVSLNDQEKALISVHHILDEWPSDGR